jgi:hypothetical protein
LLLVPLHFILHLSKEAFSVSSVSVTLTLIDRLGKGL